VKKARVLVIDDEPSVTDALRTILSDTGYEAVTAETAREGVELVRRQCFDLAIIDLKLPDISGLDVLAEMSAIRPGLAALLITAHDTDEIREAAASAGFASVLQKPFSPSRMLDLVQAALHKR